MPDILKEEWIVERSNGKRWITAIPSCIMVLKNLSKDLAFHIADLHNDSIGKPDFPNFPIKDAKRDDEKV